MQPRTVFIAFCTIAVFFITVNAATTTANPPTVTTLKVKLVTPTNKPSILPGGRTHWKTKIDPRSKKLFNDYKKIILQKLQAAHNVSATFNPKPEKVSTQVVSGTRHHYLVKVPSNKYAYVTIHHQSWKKDLYKKEQNVAVHPKLYDLNDKIVS